MASGSIRTKLFLLALLPSITIALFLGGFLTQSRLADYAQLTIERGRVAAQQLATLSQYSLHTGDLQQLQLLANAALEEKGVRAVAIYNQRKQRIIQAGPNIDYGDFDASPASTTNHRVIDNASQFTAPVFRQYLISDTQFNQPFPTTDTSHPIGWVLVEYSDTAYAVKKYQTLLISLLITTITLIVCFIFAMSINRKILQALENLQIGLTHLRTGDLDYRIPLNTEAELNALAESINIMASSVQKTFDEKQHSVEQTTADLKETLETIEIQNIELDLARKEAVEASRIKSEFLANTSHEIRTPLNGIIGFTNLLLKSEVDPLQKDYLETIQQSSQSLLTIINDILDFSKIEAGKLVLDHVPINLREIIEETLAMLAPSAQEKGIELILLIYPDVPVTLIGDPLRIKQIVTNLVSNAIKFTIDGHVMIKVNLEDNKDNLAHIMISVTDTGIGLSPPQQRDIFNAFTQANTSTSREYGGTGLGLVISKRLVEQMGGDIGLESEQGKGSTFWFSLRAKRADDDTLKAFGQIRGKRVGIFETNAVNQLSLKCLLESWHAHPVLIENHGNDTELDPTLDVMIVGVSPDKQVRKESEDLIKRIMNNSPLPLVVLSPNNQWQSDQSGWLPGLSRPLATGQIIVKPAASHKLYKGLIAALFPQTSQDNQEPVKASAPVRLGFKPTILAVDDNEANLKLISVLLRDMGAYVVEASSGLDALRHVEMQPFDLIFMDIQMPEMDGVTATARIRALPEPIANTPIIALTAHALTEERTALLNAGLNDHITKPISETQLRQVIQRWCPKSTGARLDMAGKSTDTEPPQDMVQPPVIIAACLDLANHKPELAIEMLDLLMQRLPAELAAITQAFDEKNFEALREHVHKLHGACCYTGTLPLRHTLHQYETLLKKQLFNHLGEQQHQLEMEARRLIAWQEEHDLPVVFGLEEGRST